MYGTRKEINEKLKRAFTNNEPLAVLVWSRETVTDVFDEELTDAEVDHLMCRIGGVAFYGHAAEGISRHTLGEWLSFHRSARTVTVEAELLKKITLIAQRALLSKEGRAWDAGNDCPPEVREGLDNVARVLTLLAA
ncbi:DUF1380 family protein [Erwinia amylovora]|uniref:DUF1380 family protein n=1 Tax=Erwinia amylovora TaxID=552 RepID=UPI001443C7E2|nr:DUF1380 family protein [Erwinia amylovora]